jgi:Tol biopolymer transport system component
LLIAMLAASVACSAERILAFAGASGAGGDVGGAGGIATGAGGNISGAGGSPGDGATNPIDAGSSTPFGMPQIVTGLRSDTDDVQDPSLTFEQLELYFASPTGGQLDIWVSRRTVASDPWGPSTLVAELSSPQNDEDPEVSVDGLFMYFASDRGGAERIYMSQRRTRDTPWGMPALVSTLGASTLDKAPGLDRAQLNLAFASQRGTASAAHLFTATRPDASAAWLTASEITALSSAWEDSDPALFSSGSGLVFASRRLTQGGTADLFQAARPDESSPFESLAPITELNTSFTEESPWVSQDGKHILFTSDRSGHRRIYEAFR